MGIALLIKFISGKSTSEIGSTYCICRAIVCSGNNDVGHIKRTWLRHYAKSRKVAVSSPDEVDFLIYLILPAALWPWVDWASNRNEYQESSWGVKVLPARKANNLAAICEPIV
jgi:hypothetical protein